MPALKSPVPSRLIVTADLHFDVLRSRASAEHLIAQINRTEADAVVVVGDTAAADSAGDSSIEACLGRFRSDRPNLFVPGNHEWWSRRRRIPVASLQHDELPRRVAGVGWHWLPGSPVAVGQVGIVGSCGWYDYQFASRQLGLPRRFYEAGLSPGAARRLGRDDLLDGEGATLREDAFVARWNDTRFIADLPGNIPFRDAHLERLRADLGAATAVDHIVAAIHVCPHPELLPRVPPGPVPPEKLKYAFARAYLGSPRFGKLLSDDSRVRRVLCGHSHIHRHFEEAERRWTNIGSGYTRKRFEIVSL